MEIIKKIKRLFPIRVPKVRGPEEIKSFLKKHKKTLTAKKN